jgi:hypothetical protein
MTERAHQALAPRSPKSKEPTKVTTRPDDSENPVPFDRADH